MRQTLSRLLQVRREEGGLMLLALSFAFGSVAQTVVIRIFADALLLTEFDASTLPGFFIGSSVLGMAVSLAYAQGIGRLDSARLNTAILAGLALLCLAARPLTPLLGAPFVFALCLLLTVSAPLVRILCWNAITECFDTRQAKRLLPIAGAGSTVGAILAGLAATPFVYVLGTDDLLWVIAGLFLGMAWIPRHLARKAAALSEGERSVRARSRRDESSLRSTALGLAAMRHNRLVATLAATLFLGAVATVLLDYGLKTAVQARFTKDDMAAFLGQYQALANASILVVQLFVVGRVLVGLGVRIVFSILPLALIAGGVGMGFAPAFLAIVAANFCDLLFRYTFQNAAAEMVLTPVPILQRNRAKVVTKGVMVPAGGLLAGLLLLPFQALWPDPADAWRVVGWMTAGVACIWLYFVLRVKRHYMDELRTTLGFGRVVLAPPPEVGTLLDADAAEGLIAELDKMRPEELDFSIELLASGLQHIPQVRRLLGHPMGRVRAAALRAIGTHRLNRHRRLVLELLTEEKDAEAIHAALSALRAVGDYRAVAVAGRFRAHADRRVRAEALSFLFHLGSDADRLLARRTVEEWMNGTPEERCLAAYLIGEMEHDVPSSLGVHAPKHAPAPWDLGALGVLLSDRDRRVRMAAYIGVGRARLIVYLPRLVQGLSAREEAQPAAAGLRAFAGEAVPALLEAVRGRGCPDRLRLRILHTLGSIDTPESVHALVALLREGETGHRRLAIRSLHRLRARLATLPHVRGKLVEALLAEVRLAHLCFGLVAEAHDEGVDEFFIDEVQLRLRGTAERIFELLGLLYDPRVLKGLHRRYRRGPAKVRANTLELLENLVDPELRRPLALLLEDAPLPERNARARAAWALSADGSFFDTLLDASDDGWLQRCLLFVSRAELLPRYPSRTREIERMTPLLARVILLKSVPLFAELSGESLYPIAEIAESVSVPRGTVIFDEGDIGNYLYVTVCGEVEIVRGGARVATCGPREAFGEMALLDDRPRSAKAVVVDDAELLRIAAEPFGDLLDQHPEISRGIIRVLLAYARGGGAPSPI